MTQIYTTGDGEAHPISDGFLLYPKGWTEQAEHSALERWRAGEELTPAEREYLTAWNNRENLERAWRFIGDGPHYTEHFGPEGTLDQVHGQAWSPDTCGCTVHQVFDHHQRDCPPELHPHRTHVLCDRHATIPELATDHRAHHDHLVRECQLKEAVMNAVTEAHGLDVKQRPKWHFDKNHELVIDTSDHPHLKPENIRPILREQFAHAVVHVR